MPTRYNDVLTRATDTDDAASPRRSAPRPCRAWRQAGAVHLDGQLRPTITLDPTSVTVRTEEVDPARSRLPDVDNYANAVLDALNPKQIRHKGRVIAIEPGTYKDDEQVHEFKVVKQ